MARRVERPRPGRTAPSAACRSPRTPSPDTHATVNARHDRRDVRRGHRLTGLGHHRWVTSVSAVGGNSECPPNVKWTRSAYLSQMTKTLPSAPAHSAGQVPSRSRMACRRSCSARSSKVLAVDREVHRHSDAVLMVGIGRVDQAQPLRATDDHAAGAGQHSGRINRQRDNRSVTRGASVRGFGRRRIGWGESPGRGRRGVGRRRDGGSVQSPLMLDAPAY